MGGPTELAVMLPHDFGIETRGKGLNLIGKIRHSFGRGNFTNYRICFRTLVVLAHNNIAALRMIQRIVYW